MTVETPYTLAGLYADRARAEQAYAWFEGAGFQEHQLQLAHGRVASDPDSFDEHQEAVNREAAIGSATGGAWGPTAAMAAGAPPALFIDWLLRSQAAGGLGALAVAAAVEQRLSHAELGAILRDALGHGCSVLVVRAYNRCELDRAQLLLASTVEAPS